MREHARIGNPKISSSEKSKLNYSWYINENLGLQYESIFNTVATSSEALPLNTCKMPLLSIHTLWSVQWLCLRTGRILIRLCGCAGWSGLSLSAYARRYVFAWPGPYINDSLGLWYGSIYLVIILSLLCEIIGYLFDSFLDAHLVSNIFDAEYSWKIMAFVILIKGAKQWLVTSSSLFWSRRRNIALWRVLTSEIGFHIFCVYLHAKHKYKYFVLNIRIVRYGMFARGTHIKWNGQISIPLRHIISLNHDIYNKEVFSSKRGETQLFITRACKNLSSGVFGQRRPSSVCASAQFYQDIRCPQTESLECFNGEQMPDETLHMQDEIIRTFYKCARSKALFRLTLPMLL